MKNKIKLKTKNVSFHKLETFRNQILGLLALSLVTTSGGLVHSAPKVPKGLQSGHSVIAAKGNSSIGKAGINTVQVTNAGYAFKGDVGTARVGLDGKFLDYNGKLPLEVRLHGHAEAHLTRNQIVAGEFRRDSTRVTGPLPPGRSQSETSYVGTSLTASPAVYREVDIQISRNYLANNQLDTPVIITVSSKRPYQAMDQTVVSHYGLSLDREMYPSTVNHYFLRAVLPGMTPQNIRLITVVSKEDGQFEVIAFIRNKKSPDSRVDEFRAELSAVASPNQRLDEDDLTARIGEWRFVRTVSNSDAGLDYLPAASGRQLQKID